MARSLLILFSLVVVCIGSANAAHNMLPSSRRALQQQTKSEVAPLLQDVFSFWLKYGPDKQYGRF